MNATASPEPGSELAGVNWDSGAGSPQGCGTAEELDILRSEIQVVRDRHREAQKHIAELTDAVAARDALIAIIGPELGNPMGAIVLSVTSIVSHARTASDLPAWLGPRLEALDRQCRGLVRRTNVLLDTSQLMTGHLQPDCRTVCLGDLVGEVIRELAPEADRAACGVCAEIEPGVVGSWDMSGLHQVAFSWISNAIKYGNGRQVRVQVEQDTEFARFKVSDQGDGISKTDCQRMFEPFERAVRREARPGFGLGLWVARQWIEAHGGKISVTSELGVGSVFTASLPRGI